MQYDITVRVDLGPDYDQVDTDTGAEILIPSTRTLLNAAPEGTLLAVEDHHEG